MRFHQLGDKGPNVTLHKHDGLIHSKGALTELSYHHLNVQMSCGTYVNDYDTEMFTTSKSLTKLTDTSLLFQTLVALL
jgi:hypothetical protein